MAEKHNDRRVKKPSLYWQRNDRRIATDELYSPFKPRPTPFQMAPRDRGNAVAPLQDEGERDV